MGKIRVDFNKSSKFWTVFLKICKIYGLKKKKNNFSPSSIKLQIILIPIKISAAVFKSCWNWKFVANFNKKTSGNL